MKVRTWLAALLLTVSAPVAAEQPPPAANEPVSADEVRALVDGNNALAIKLLQLLAPELHGGNLIFSPISVTSALGVIYAGEAGDAARQVAVALGTTEPPGRLARVLGVLLEQLRQHGKAKDSKEGRTDILNAAFLGQLSVVSPAYRQAIESELGGTVGTFDSPGGSRSLTHAINQWADRETQGRIKSIVCVEDFHEPGMVLANAVFLTQFWDELDRARPARFNLRPGHTVLAPTLSDDDHAWPYLAEQGFLVVEKGFFAAGEALDVFLPRPEASMDATTLVAALSPALLQSSLAGLRSEHIRFAMPKFETGRRLDLIPPLRSLGVSLPFEPGADFPAIASPPVHLVRLSHDVRIKVDEKGVRASAVTTGEFDLGMSGGPPRHSFIADHPFLILVRDLPTGAILFLGVINNPLLKD